MGKKKVRPKNVNKKKSGLLMGMRSGFQKGARAVTGLEQKPGKKAGDTIWTIITILAVLAFAFMMARRFHII